MLHWTRFRLRSLLIVVTLIAALCGWVAYERDKCARQLAVAEYFRSKDNKIRPVSKANTRRSPALAYVLGDNTYSGPCGLDIWGADVTEDDLARLEALPRLTYLLLNGPRYTDRSLNHISRHKRLKLLYLSRTSITDQGLDNLAGMNELERLFVRRTSITDDGLARICTFKRLKELDISETAITDAGLHATEKLEELEDLSLARNCIGDAALNHLPKKRLQILNLDDTGITDDGLDYLQDMPQLRVLHIGWTQVSDAGLARLGKIRSLKEVHIDEPPTTEQGVSALLESLPNVMVYDQDRANGRTIHDPLDP